MGTWTRKAELVWWQGPCSATTPSPNEPIVKAQVQGEARRSCQQVGIRISKVQGWAHIDAQRGFAKDRGQNLNVAPEPRCGPQRDVSQLVLTPLLSSQQSDPWLRSCTVAELTFRRSKQTSKRRAKSLQSLSVPSGLWHLSLNIWFHREWLLGVFQCVKMQLYCKNA